MGSLSQLEARSRHSSLLALWLLLKLMLMLMLPILPMAMDTPMPMLESPLVPALVLTQSPRVLMLSPRELLFHTLDIMDMLVTTLARGLLMLMPTMLPILMHMLEFPLDPAQVLTPSPRVLMLQPRDMLPTMDMDTTHLASKLEDIF